MLAPLLLALAATAPSPSPSPSPEATSLGGAPLFAPPLAPDRRKALEADLLRAEADLARAPGSADALIWVGRRLGYLGRFREAIAVFTRGIAAHPADPRFYRHRGHRSITVRELDRAVADLTRAAELAAARPDEVEPDGQPNARNVPTSTLRFNVWYHLGLARFLQGDFDAAREAYRRCMETTGDSADRLVATSDWLYMTLRRLGRGEEAARVLEPIRADLDVVENHAYFQRLLFYKGERKAGDLLAPREDGVDTATLTFGVAHQALVDGEASRARSLFEKIVATTPWPAFAHIAAEAELARMGGRTR